MKRFTETEMQNILIDNIGVSEETLITVVKINGNLPKTYEDILFVYTEYRTFEQYLEEVGNEH